MPHEVAARRKRKEWAQFLGLGAALIAVSLVAGLSPLAGEVSSALLVPLVLVPAALLLAVFARMIREMGELERRIVSQALALAFIVTCAAMIAYPFLEALAVPRLRPQTVCALLVGSFGVGIGIFSRRYE